MYLSFHYLGFEGSFPGSLAVSVLGQSNKINMWEKGQDMGNQWNYEVLYLGRQKGPFKVSHACIYSDIPF